MDSLKKYFDIETELNSYKVPVPADFSSRAVHAGQDPKQWSSRALVAPIHTSSMYHLDDQTNYKYIYHRGRSPSKDVLERCFASINYAKFALMFSSGQGATSSLMMNLGSGAHVIICKYIYGYTSNVFMNEGVKIGITHSFVDVADFVALKSAITPQTKMVFFESPSNPTLKCFDIQKISDFVHTINKDILVVVDNTFMSPFLQRPLSLGADLIMYSCSKYVNGHSDVVMGALVTNNEELYTSLFWTQVRTGNIPSAFDCYLVLRGIKTLPLRMRQHFRNALVVAKFLQSHPAVERVVHPALLTDSAHEVATKQSSGHCGIVTFWLKDATSENMKQILNKLKMIATGVSLGGPESLVTTPIAIAALSQPKDVKDEVGITPNCVRLSVGLEDPLDVIQDLNQAFEVLITKAKL